MEIWDRADSVDLIIYKFKVGFMTFLAEVEISSSKLLTLRDYNRYMQDLPEDILLVGEFEYNQAIKYLKDKSLIRY